jgi:hypothetical protein
MVERETPRLGVERGVGVALAVLARGRDVQADERVVEREIGIEPQMQLRQRQRHRLNGRRNGLADTVHLDSRNEGGLYDAGEDEAMRKGYA